MVFFYSWQNQTSFEPRLRLGSFISRFTKHFRSDCPRATIVSWTWTLWENHAGPSESPDELSQAITSSTLHNIQKPQSQLANFRRIEKMQKTKNKKCSLKQTHFETEKSQTKQLREQKNLNLKFFVQWHKFTLRHLLKAIVCLSKYWVYKILQELRLKFELYVGGREKWKRAVSDRKK